MFSDMDIVGAAHLTIHEYRGDVELEAAKYADLMLGHRDGPLTWARGWRTIAVMQQAPTGLPQ